MPSYQEADMVIVNMRSCGRKWASNDLLYLCFAQHSGCLLISPRLKLPSRFFSCLSAPDHAQDMVYMVVLKGI
jgi:hypothetical protein